MPPWGSRRGVPRTTRARVLERDGWQCQLALPGCTFHAEEIDHIAGVAKLGYDDDSDENLRAACRKCHRARSGAQRDAASRASNAHRYARRHLPKQKHPGDP